MLHVLRGRNFGCQQKRQQVVGSLTQLLAPGSKTRSLWVCEMGSLTVFWGTRIRSDGKQPKPWWPWCLVPHRCWSLWLCFENRAPGKSSGVYIYIYTYIHGCIIIFPLKLPISWGVNPANPTSSSFSDASTGIHIPYWWSMVIIYPSPLWFIQQAFADRSCGSHQL